MIPNQALKAVILSKEGAVLILKRNKPDEPETWDLPGGLVEPEETFELALHR